MGNKEENTYYCIITNEPKYIPPSLAKNKIAKFGSKEEFQKYYVSKQARKLLKSGNTVDQIRKALNCPKNLPAVDSKILYKLKLIKIRTRKGAKDHQEVLERRRYLNSPEFREKMAQIKERRENMSFQDWVEENTGIGRSRGGTCLRPDIFLSWNRNACDGCDYYEHCLCYQKRLSHEKRKRRR